VGRGDAVYAEVLLPIAMQNAVREFEVDSNMQIFQSIFLFISRN
jgi:hypothetical protein